MSEAPARMLGIDFGQRRIGVAVSEGRIAVPLTIVDHTNRMRDLDQIAKIAIRETITAIVVGLPLAPDGGEGEQARLTRAFGSQLAERTSLPVVYQDERLTSVDITPPRAKRKARPVDDLAAAAILQRHIDSLQGAPDA
jgi:putative Holliday junction resolvase